MKRSRRILLWAGLSAVCVVPLFPVYWMGVTSLIPRHEIFRYPPTFVPWPPYFAAYRDLFGATQLTLWIGNSALVVAVSTFLSVAVSVLAAYSISRFPARISVATGYVLLATRMVPPTLLVMPLYLVFQRAGLLDTRTALVAAYTTFEIPFATWMLKGYFDSIPKELEEAAQVDGCSPLGALSRVILPVSWPGIVASVVASAILGWSDYVFALTFISNPNRWTVTVGIASFFGEHETLWNEVMGGALIATLPIVVLFLIMGRYLVSGLTAGAVKG